METGDQQKSGTKKQNQWKNNDSIANVDAQ